MDKQICPHISQELHSVQSCGLDKDTASPAACASKVTELCPGKDTSKEREQGFARHSSQSLILVISDPQGRKNIRALQAQNNKLCRSYQRVKYH